MKYKKQVIEDQNNSSAAQFFKVIANLDFRRQLVLVHASVRLQTVLTELGCDLNPEVN